MNKSLYYITIYIYKRDVIHHSSTSEKFIIVHTLQHLYPDCIFPWPNLTLPHPIQNTNLSLIQRGPGMGPLYLQRKSSGRICRAIITRKEEQTQGILVVSRNSSGKKMLKEERAMSILIGPSISSSCKQIMTKVQVLRRYKANPHQKLQLLFHRNWTN